jgi:Ca2+-binding EF-hand superfamily protein
MNKKHILIALALVVAPAVSFAAKADGPKARAMAQFDADKDGKFNEAELAAVRASFAAQPTGDLQRFDTDKDGRLSDAEIAQMIPGSGKKSGEKKNDKADPKKGEKKANGKKDAEKPKAGKQASGS